MWLTHRNKRCVQIDQRVFNRLLSFYPEENLLTREVPSEALRRHEIKKTDLQKESDKHFIPWQMFLLNWENLVRQLKKIEGNRRDKISTGSYSTRSGRSGIIPNRLIDRYIRSQNFLVTTEVFPSNKWNKLLVGKSVSEAVATIISHFGISRDDFWTKSTKERALEYLVEHISSHQINVALGTSESRLVPTTENHKVLYKNISGFCLKDEKVPFIFVNMNMAGEEEPAGRQIYSLVYLLILVGLDIFTLTRDLRPESAPKGNDGRYFRLAHEIASAFLIPSSALEPYSGKKITSEIVRTIGDYHKITPSAVIFRLWKEKYITKEEKDLLTPPAFIKKNGGRTPHIQNAVRKLNGILVYTAANTAFRAGNISQNQAQYILFGRIRRKTWRDYRARLKI